MLTHPTIEKLHALHLTAMATAFEQQRGSSQHAELSFDDRLGLGPARAEALKSYTWNGAFAAKEESLKGSTFFQSFMEVRVERSTGLLRLWLDGVDGRLPWGAIQVGGATQPASASNTDPVEWTVPLPEPRGPP